MSDYNIQVSWSGKDALADSDPDKVISGGDFNTEFTAVKTALNSKSNLNGNSGEDFDATTQAASNNTNKVATTAFVTTATSAAKIADVVYPVGSIFITTTAYAASSDVVAAIGGGSWSTFGAGKVPVGFDSSDTDFDTIEETGGVKTHTLTSAQVPSHRHRSLHGGHSGSIPTDWTGVSSSETPTSFGGGTDDDDWAISYTTFTGGDSSDGDQTIGATTAHTLVQPYITVYMWKRLT